MQTIEFLGRQLPLVSVERPSTAREVLTYEARQGSIKLMVSHYPNWHYSGTSQVRVELQMWVQSGNRHLTFEGWGEDIGMAELALKRRWAVWMEAGRVMGLEMGLGDF